MAGFSLHVVVFPVRSDAVPTVSRTRRHIHPRNGVSPLFSSCSSAGCSMQIFVIGLVHTPVGVFTCTLRTLPSSPGNVSCTLPMFHFPRIAFGSATITTSSTCTFLFSVVHFFLGTSCGNTSRAHLFQNASTSF